MITARDILEALEIQCIDEHQEMLVKRIGIYLDTKLAVKTDSIAPMEKFYVKFRNPHTGNRHEEYYYALTFEDALKEAYKLKESGEIIGIEREWHS